MLESRLLVDAPAVAAETCLSLMRPVADDHMHQTFVIAAEVST
jgi:hypothetical protein